MTDDKASERSDLWAGELAADAADTTDAKNTQNPWDVQSIRDSWNPNSVRLPDSLQRRFNAYHSRVESELTMEGIEREYSKDRYYKPLVIALGLKELDAMDTQDVVDALDDLERSGHLED